MATMYPPCLPVAGGSSQMMVLYGGLCVSFFLGRVHPREAYSEKDISLQNVYKGMLLKLASVERKWKKWPWAGGEVETVEMQSLQRPLPTSLGSLKLWWMIFQNCAVDPVLVSGWLWTWSWERSSLQPRQSSEGCSTIIPAPGRGGRESFVPE